jgi:hypothetical protein
MTTDRPAPCALTVVESWLSTVVSNLDPPVSRTIRFQRHRVVGISVQVGRPDHTDGLKLVPRPAPDRADHSPVSMVSAVTPKI